MAIFTNTPTFADQRWGPESWALLDYYRNPTRVGVDALHPNGQNPVLFFRHSSGSTVGDHRRPRSSADTQYYYFFRWLLQNQPGNPQTDTPPGSITETQVGPALHWDLCSFTSGQRKHKNTIPRSRAVYFPEAIQDWQRAIASIKRMSTYYGFNPNLVGHIGESFGAWVSQLGLLGLSPLILGDEDSSINFNIYSQGPTDIRNSVPLNPTTGTDAYYYTAIGNSIGVRSDAGDAVVLPGPITTSHSNELDAYPHLWRDWSSPIWYYLNGIIGGHVPTYITFPLAGDGIKPYGGQSGGSNPHDSAQVAELAAAMAGAGLVEGTDFIQEVIGSTDTTTLNLQYPAEPTDALVLAYYNRLAAFMAQFGVAA